MNAGKKILIIDDSAQDRKIIERFLNRAGFRDVLFAEKGEDGVKKTELEKPDLVIIDTVLPTISGYETCRRIRKSLGLITPKIIIMTGHAEAIDAVEARGVEADEYWVKSPDFASLIKRVERFVLPEGE